MYNITKIEKGVFRMGAILYHCIGRQDKDIFVLSKVSDGTKKVVHKNLIAEKIWHDEIRVDNGYIRRSKNGKISFILKPEKSTDTELNKIEQNIKIKEENNVKETNSRVQPWLSVIKKMVILDKAGMWHFPTGKDALLTMKELKKKGFIFICNGVETTYEQFKERIEQDCHTSGACVVRFYSEISEYIDKKNKVYYVKLGSLMTEDLYC